MKPFIKLAAFACIFSGSLGAQPNPTAINGGKLYINQRVTFGGSQTLSLVSGIDTLSDPVVVEVSGVRPYQVMALEYDAISADSSNSGYRIDFWSRTCANPVQSTTCPNIWLKPPRRLIYNTQPFADTVIVSKVPQDTTRFSHNVFLTTGNQVRLRFRNPGSSAQHLQNIVILGD